MKKWFLAGAMALALAACSTEAPNSAPSSPAMTPPSPASSANARPALLDVLEEMNFKRPPGPMPLLESYRQEADGSLSLISTFRPDKSIITAGGYEPRPNNRKMIPTPKGEKLWITFYCTTQEPTATLDKEAIKAKIEEVLKKVTERRVRFEGDPQPRITLKGDRVADLQDYPNCHLYLRP